jgi:hypothetical protein
MASGTGVAIHAQTMGRVEGRHRPGRRGSAQNQPKAVVELCSGQTHVALAVLSAPCPCSKPS